LINFIVHIELALKAVLACGSMVLSIFVGVFRPAGRKTPTKDEQSVASVHPSKKDGAVTLPRRPS
jgi:hypothetical protein